MKLAVTIGLVNGKPEVIFPVSETPESHVQQLRQLVDDGGVIKGAGKAKDKKVTEAYILRTMDAYKAKRIK